MTRARAELIDWSRKRSVSDSSVANDHTGAETAELPELIGLCTRILVGRETRVVGDGPRAEFSEARLTGLMSGVAAE